MEYKIDDKILKAPAFIEFVNKVWQGNYDIDKTQDALAANILSVPIWQTPVWI